METCDAGGISVDYTVGTIVWVRRRNGSWWPGRILGLDELSASNLMSPRSGTPVKLLGREDASVDWYNLEKSKRVKSFRCGEFDACIERAEASQSTLIKKREKYARREDAILHALELENQQKLGTTLNGIYSKTIGPYKSEPITLSSPETYMRRDEPITHGKVFSGMCENFLKNVAFSHNGEDADDPLYLHLGRSNQQFRSEHDNTESIPRRRGLHDFGLRTAQSKRKLSLSRSWENSSKSVDNHVYSLSSSGYIMDGADQVSTSRNAVAVKRKRSYGGVIDVSLDKKRDRRRPLVQVLQSSAKLHSLSFGPSCSATGTSKIEEMNKIGSTWQVKRSRSVYLPANLDDHPDLGCTSSGLNEVTNSDYCDDDLLEPDMMEERDMLIDSTDILLPGSKDCDPLSGFMSQLHGQAIETSSESSVSKWRMKGKRNIRNAIKKVMDEGDTSPGLERCNGSINSTYESKSSLKLGRRFCRINEELEYTYDSDEEPSNRVSNAFWEEPVELFKRDYTNHPLNEMEPLLVDVDLKVEASYQGEHVPLVSLMSRLNGKAIIGHPIPIEVVEDGSSIHPHDVVMDEGTAPQAVWRTARRTAMQRVPRSIPLTSAFDEIKPPLHKKTYYLYLKQQVRPTKKKNVKRVSLSSKKTRTLSSLASNETVSFSNGILGSVQPLVTCVPVKVVFSRILEAVARP